MKKRKFPWAVVAAALIVFPAFVREHYEASLHSLLRKVAAENKYCLNKDLSGCPAGGDLSLYPTSANVRIAGVVNAQYRNVIATDSSDIYPDFSRCMEREDKLKAENAKLKSHIKELEREHKRAELNGWLPNSFSSELHPQVRPQVSCLTNEGEVGWYDPVDHSCHPGVVDWRSEPAPFFEPDDFDFHSAMKTAGKYSSVQWICLRVATAKALDKKLTEANARIKELERWCDGVVTYQHDGLADNPPEYESTHK